MWWLEKEPGGYWKIRNDHSNLYLDVLAAAKQNGARVSQWISDPGDQQKWKIETAEKLELPDLSTGSFSSEPPALTGMGEPSDGNLVEVERILVPFFFVKDKSMVPSEQVSRSPYYVLSTSKQWKAVDVQPNPDDAPMELTVLKQTTKSTLISTEVKQIVSATVTVKMSYGFAEAEASVSASRRTKENTETGTSDLNANTKIKKVNGGDILVFWNANVTFKILRMEGDEIYSREKPGKFIVENTFSMPKKTVQ